MSSLTPYSIQPRGQLESILCPLADYSEFVNIVPKSVALANSLQFVIRNFHKLLPNHIPDLNLPNPFGWKSTILLGLSTSLLEVYRERCAITDPQFQQKMRETSLKLIQFIQDGEKLAASPELSPYVWIKDSFEETYQNLAQLKTSAAFDSTASSILKNFYNAKKFSGFKNIRSFFHLLKYDIEHNEISVTETEEKTVKLWVNFFNDLGSLQ